MIKVRCFNALPKNNTPAYEFVHVFVHADEKLKERSRRMDNKPVKFSVLMLVLDSVSMSSMRRALPKTLALLQNMSNFYLFKKHHVTGSNTLQNLVPMLANRVEAELLRNSINASITPPFDDFPFIWKNFSKR